MARRRARMVVSPLAVARVRAAGEWLAAQAADAEVLVLAGAHDAADDLVRDAVAAAGARFGVFRLGLDALVGRLTAVGLAQAGRVWAPALAIDAVVARAVHRLAGAGELGALAAIAGRPGLPAALARTLGELRMNAVPPERLAALDDAGPVLARLAAAIEGELAAVGLADRATAFAEAIRLVASATPPRPAGLPLALLDVSVASAHEEALVSALAARASTVLATVPAGDEATIGRLARALGAKPVHVAPAEATTSLGALAAHLFEETSPAPRTLAADGTVTLAAVPGEARECVEIARGVLAAAADGVPFDRIAVLLRTPGDYVAHLEEAFGRADIPAFFAREARRPNVGGRAFLALLACAGDNLSARRFAEYLSLGQVPDAPCADGATGRWRPPWAGREEHEADVPVSDDTFEDPDAEPSLAGTVPTPARWEQLLVDAAVIGGRERWVRRLDGLEHALRRQLATADQEGDPRRLRLERDLLDLGHLRACALPLVERLEALPAAATWGEWLGCLEALAVAAIREPDYVLDRLRELAPMAPVGPIDLDEVQLVLGPRLREDRDTRSAGRRHGRVFVAPIGAARGMTFDVVFVPGLAEKLFPGKITEDPILLDARRRLLGVGDLVTEPERVVAERLALRLAVGAATRRLHLSYPRVDVEKGRPRVPSFYALEVLRAAEGRLPALDDLVRRAEETANARLGWPAPGRPDEAIDEAEYDLALLAPILDADPDTTIGTATYLVSANPHLARALRARGRRWLRRWTPADGLVEPETFALAALARHRLAARSYSPTALQHFAACPYRFFLQAIHRLAPREEPVAIERVDPLTRGGLVHDVQYELLTRLRDQGLLPVDRSRLERAFALLEEALADVAARWHDDLSPAIERVWDDAVTAIRADLREWLGRMVDDPEWVPYRFELSFGLPDRDRAHADPDSIADPVRLDDGLLVRGAIDLVERRADGTLRVTDHKTGRAYGKPDMVIAGGRVLQPVLYALAAERLVGAPVLAGRLYFCTATGEWTERTVPIDTGARESAAVVARTIDAAIAEGFLPAAPEPGACRFCDYRSVCGPYEEIRILQKPSGRLAALARLRECP